MKDCRRMRERSTCNKIKECIDKFLMSKEETERYLEDQQGITRQDTNTGSPRERASAILGDQEQQASLPDLNVPAASPQEANAVGTSRADSNDIEKQNVQTSQQQQQQPVIPNDFWQQLLNTLGQIQSSLNTLGQIQSNTDQMVKLLTDGHGLGPHPSAAGSLKRKRVGENEERGENEEGEKLQENERDGNNEEAEKQIIEKEEVNDEEAEKKEEGDNEGLQKKDEVDNEELQKNERGDN
ncbi:hypothetical protein Bca101_064317 [Brassica carinata]